MSNLRLILLPFSLMFFVIIKLRNFLYEKGFLETYKSPVPVICIGNLTTGGTGKTPVLINIAKKLSDMNFKLAILSRGYKRLSSGFFKVDSNDTEKFGDEPVLIKNNLPSADVYVCEDRVEGIKKINNNNTYKFILLDDGFQHKKLYKDYSILVFDLTDNSILNKFLLPAGNLRETSSSIMNSDALVYNFKFSENNTQYDIPIYKCIYLTDGFYDADNKRVELEEIIANKFYAFCGIGKPDGFFNQLIESKLNILRKETFSDHFRFNKSVINKIISKAKGSGCDALITTEKDYYRLINFLSEIKNNSLKLFYLKIKAEISNSDEIISEICKIKVN